MLSSAGGQRSRLCFALGVSACNPVTGTFSVKELMLMMREGEKSSTSNQNERKGSM
jgi:hypothetical protein